MTTKCNNHCMAHTRIGHDAASKCSVHHNSDFLVSGMKDLMNQDPTQQ